MTQQQALPPLTKDLVDAFFASATLWLARLLGLLLHPRAAMRKRLFTRLIQFAERWVEHILFVAAAQRLGVVFGRRRRTVQRIAGRPGFRIAVGSNRLLWKSAHIKLRSRDLIARIARLLEALTHSERYVAHYVKRLACGLCFRRLVACAPGAVTLSADPLAEIALCDSS
jgi:hypothetical protein